MREEPGPLASTDVCQAGGPNEAARAPDVGDDPAGSSMILFAVSTLSYTDTRTIGWPFLMTIPAVSAASAVAYDRFVCLSTWSKNRPTSGRLLCESNSCTVSGAGSSASRSLITRVAIRCLFLLKNDSLGTVRY